MKLTAAEAREVVQEDSEDFESVSIEISDTSRWSIQYTGVFRHIPTGKFYEFDWQVGATEQQDEGPYEYASEVEPVEVESVQVMVTKWVAISK